MQIGFSSVHEVEENLEIVSSGAIKDDVELVVDCSIGGCMAEQGLEVSTAC